MENKKTVVIAGSVTTNSGYGSRSRDIARALIRSGKYDVKILPLRWGSTPQDALNGNDPNDRMILERMVAGNIPQKPDIFIHVTIPNEFQRAGKYNIGITAGIETTVCRPDWIEGCNRMDLVLTSSEHSKRVFQESKFEKRDQTTQQVIDVIQLRRPVEVLFEGVDTTVYNKTRNPESNVSKHLDTISEDFAFLFVGHWLQGAFGEDRKDVGTLIRVFLESFRHKLKSKMPCLILKTSLAGFSTTEKHILLDRISDIRNAVRGKDKDAPLPNIYLMYGSLTDAEMNDLYNHPKVKAMVSFTKGEGFGRPLLEFTTTGKPIIASGWSGQMDFLHPDHSILLRGNLKKVHESAVNDWIIRDSQWFNVDPAYASQKMLEVHKLYDKIYDVTKKHRRHTLENFSLLGMQEKLDGYISNIESYAAYVATPSPAPLALPKLKVSKPNDTASGGKSTQIVLPKLKKV